MRVAIAFDIALDLLGQSVSVGHDNNRAMEIKGSMVHPLCGVVTDRSSVLTVRCSDEQCCSQSRIACSVCTAQHDVAQVRCSLYRAATRAQREHWASGPITCRIGTTTILLQLAGPYILPVGSTNT